MSLLRGFFYRDTREKELEQPDSETVVFCCPERPSALWCVEGAHVVLVRRNAVSRDPGMLSVF